jgi:predicted dehydrogenase
LVGVVGLEVPRRPFYFKEASFVVSCSYGPGRYDPDYEDRGHDYPAAYVRWTEQRNIGAVLDLMGSGRLDVSALISHRFDIGEAHKAYELIESGREPYLGIVLRYPEIEAPTERRIVLRPARATGLLGVGCIGAGNFARMVLLPAIRKTGTFTPRVLCSAGGLSAAHTGEQLGFEAATTDEREVVDDPRVQAVFVITRHDQHARQVLATLTAGKHCFVEKPLALTIDELMQIDAALREAGERPPLLMVGFNRRFSTAAKEVRAFFSSMRAPLTMSFRFNAGEIPPEHWVQDEGEGGGRIIGEACHAIDLATYLTGSPPVRVFAESIGGPDTPAVTDDQCFITLRHANGSVSSIAYLAGGDRALPKERVEVFGGGRGAIIDDFRSVTTAVGGKLHTMKVSGKGHVEEIQAFARALRTGSEAPISWDHLYRVSLASILAVRSLREGVPFDVPGPGRMPAAD